MKLEIKQVGLVRPEPVKAFADLEVGTVYDSQSKFGICLKTAQGSAFSLTLGQDLGMCARQGWACRLVKAKLLWGHL